MLAAFAAMLVATAVSLAASSVLVRRLECVAAAAGLSEALLGLLTAAAADAPEVTSAVTALVRHQHDVGAGVVLGSNVFNLAALLGLGALTAGRIALHRRVVLLTGGVGALVAATAVAVTSGASPAPAMAVVAAVVLAAYATVSALSPGRLRALPLPRPATEWLASAIADEELELEHVHPRPHGRRDAVVALAAVGVVVAASTVMEVAATSLGTSLHWSDIVVGGVVLAAVTSLPNAVAAVHLARRGRGAAVLSEALNSNAVNVIAGLLVPASIIGLGGASPAGTLVAVWALLLSLAALALAFVRRGIGRVEGVAIIAAYAAFVAVLALRG